MSGDFPMQPPDVVARHVLGVPDGAALKAGAVKALFRFRVQMLRPDVAEDGRVAPQLAVLMWARDDLLHRAEHLEAERVYRQTRPPVTANGGESRNIPAWRQRRCPTCDEVFEVGYMASRRRDSRYCSNACRQRAYRQRRAAEVAS